MASAALTVLNGPGGRPSGTCTWAPPSGLPIAPEDDFPVPRGWASLSTEDSAVRGLRDESQDPDSAAGLGEVRGRGTI